jgi:hypothetical protein
MPKAGVGSRLLTHALAWAAAEHAGRPVRLELSRANTRAVAFYERHGALRTGERVCRHEQGFELSAFEYTWPEPLARTGPVTRFSTWPAAAACLPDRRHASGTHPEPRCT